MLSAPNLADLLVLLLGAGGASALLYFFIGPLQIFIRNKVHSGHAITKLSDEIFSVKFIPMIDVAKKGAVHKVTFIQTICEAMNETPSYFQRYF